MFKFARSVSLRLALGYAAIFILSSLLLVGILWWRTAAYLDREVDAVILADVRAVADRWRDFGLPGAADTIAERAGEEADEHAIYLLADPALRRLAGNLAAWPAQLGDQPGWHEIGLERGGRLHATRLLYAALPGGYRLVVGRDIQDRVVIRETIIDSLAWAAAIAVLLAIGGGYLARRAVMARVEAINRTAAAIVRGDLSRRLPVRDSSDEFEQLARTINAMLQQIEALIDGVRNASNAVAHDLRTPLAELRGRLENLLRERPAPDAAWREVRDAVGDLDRVIEVFNALLRLAEIDSGARLAGFREVRLDNVLREVAEMYAPLAEQKRIELALGAAEPSPVRGDPDLLAQAIGNLIDNAVKFSPAGSAVSVALARNERGRIDIVVADRGPGIPDAEKAEVSRRFYRGASSRGAEGVGLGLSVVAAIARLHGGALALADNQPGLIATLTVPAAA
jgi:signal transduction histidine kinase